MSTVNVAQLPELSKTDLLELKKKLEYQHSKVTEVLRQKVTQTVKNGSN